MIHDECVRALAVGWGFFSLSVLLFWLPVRGGGCGRQLGCSGVSSASSQTEHPLPLPGSLLHADFQKFGCCLPACHPPAHVLSRVTMDPEDLVFGSRNWNPSHPSIHPSISRNHRPRSRCGAWALRLFHSSQTWHGPQPKKIEHKYKYTDTWQWGPPRDRMARFGLGLFQGWGRHPKFGEFWVVVGLVRAHPGCSFVRPSGGETLEELRRHDRLFQKPGRAGSFTRRVLGLLPCLGPLGESWLVRGNYRKRACRRWGFLPSSFHPSPPVPSRHVCLVSSHDEDFRCEGGAGWWWCLQSAKRR